VVGGVSLMKFFDQTFAFVLGWIFLVSGGIAVTGTVVFVRRRRQLQRTGGTGSGSQGI